MFKLVLLYEQKKIKIKKTYFLHALGKTIIWFIEIIVIHTIRKWFNQIIMNAVSLYLLCHLTWGVSLIFNLQENFLMSSLIVNVCSLLPGWKMCTLSQLSFFRNLTVPSKSFILASWLHTSIHRFSYRSMVL